MTDEPMLTSPRSRLATLLLACLLGVFGAHRFYVGKIGTGILQLLTLGGAGLWWIYDIILISSGSFRDGEGRLVASWDAESGSVLTTDTAAAMLEEIDAMRAELADLSERVEFTERLLADPDRRRPE